MVAERRRDRQREHRREALERLLDQARVGGLEALDRVDPGCPKGLEDPERLFFHDHSDLVAGLAEVLERSGLVEACLALARHLEEDRDHWLRRLQRVAVEPRLRARSAVLEADYLEVLADHFRRLGAGGPQGERIADLEAACLLGALRGAERLWVRNQGRPILPVLVQEALAVVWPALYGHARRHLK